MRATSLRKYLLFAFVSACFGKTYGSGGADWPEPSCHTNLLNTVSPIKILTAQAVCSAKYALDYYFFNSGTQIVHLSYKGSPKTVRLSFGPTFQKLFLRVDGTRIVSYTLKELVFRVPPEHRLDDMDDLCAEGQSLFTADDPNLSGDYPRQIARSNFYVPTKSQTSGLFFSIVKALNNITADTMRLASERQPIPIVVGSMGALNTANPRPFKFFAYHGTDTRASARTGASGSSRPRGRR